MVDEGKRSERNTSYETIFSDQKFSRQPFQFGDNQRIQKQSYDKTTLKLGSPVEPENHKRPVGHNSISEFEMSLGTE